MQNYQFKPSVGMTVATIVVMAICIRLGFWQYNKAQAKIEAQQQLEEGMQTVPVTLPDIIEDEKKWRFKRVKFSGRYLTQYQFLLDNRVHNGKAGFHVITPVKLENTNEVVLVNRGWIKGNLNRELPAVDTPAESLSFVGDVYFPLDKVFSLESDSADVAVEWQPLWQHIDMARYQQLVPLNVKPFMVRLAKESHAGGFVREWPVPKSRITVHLGYAYQWFGFAATLFVIYIVLNVKKLKRENQEDE